MPRASSSSCQRHAAIRRRQFALYDEAVERLAGVTPIARDTRDTHAHHLFAVRIDPERAGADREAYMAALAAEGIATSIHFLPVHRLQWYAERFPDQAPLPVAERAGDELLSLPVSPAHSEDDIREVVAALERVHERLTP